MRIPKSEDLKHSLSTRLILGTVSVCPGPPVSFNWTFPGFRLCHGGSRNAPQVMSCHVFVRSLSMLFIGFLKIRTYGDANRGAYHLVPSSKEDVL